MARLRFALVAALSMATFASAAAQPAPSTVQVRVWSFGFYPQPIHLAAGRPVTLQFVNQSGGSHDFTAHTFFGTSRILSGDAREGEVELRGHETKTVTLVPRAGTYTAHCSHFMHDMLGMHDQIVVD